MSITAFGICGLEIIFSFGKNLIFFIIPAGHPVWAVLNYYNVIIKNNPYLGGNHRGGYLIRVVGAVVLSANPLLFVLAAATMIELSELMVQQCPGGIGHNSASPLGPSKNKLSCLLHWRLNDHSGPQAVHTQWAHTVSGSFFAHYYKPVRKDTNLELKGAVTYVYG